MLNLVDSTQELGKLNLSTRNMSYERTGLCMHSHPCLHLKVVPTKHTLKLLFGLPSRKQVSPLNLTIAMATTKRV